MIGQVSEEFVEPFSAAVNGSAPFTNVTSIPIPFAAAANVNVKTSVSSSSTNSKVATGRSVGGGSVGGGDGSNRLSRLDRLITRVDPLATVSQKMDEVWSVVVGTKSSVDNLVPKSEQLLDKTQRQERAISNIHSDLTNMADQVRQVLTIF